jgi:predicted nucleic acid-binding protein
METDSVIQTRVVEGKTTPDVADQTLALIDTAPVVIATHPHLRQRAREIARQFNQRKVYDATYAALAEFTQMRILGNRQDFFRCG